jgi:hypothetical protein
MFSDWYSDILSPAGDGEEKHIQAFDKFGVTASASTAPEIARLESREALDSFINYVGKISRRALSSVHMNNPIALKGAK